MQEQNLRLHFFYVTLILGGALVGALSVQWSGVHGLPEIISFAVGLSSLVLSMLAIVQNIVSGPANAQAISSITRLAGEVSGSAQDLGRAREQLEARVSMLDDLPTSMKELVGKVDSLATLSLSDKIGGDARSSEGWKRTTTMGGLVSIYISARAMEREKAFSVDDIFPDAPAYAEYYNGYVAALWATGSIDASLRDDKRFVVTGIGNGQAGEITSWVREKLKANEQTELFEGVLANVDKFFEAPRRRRKSPKAPRKPGVRPPA